MSQPRIAVDAMGGDGSIAVTVPAARQLAEQAQLVLVGDIQQIRAIDPLIEQCCQLVQADTQVFPQDSIRQILRHRQDSSMHVALSLLSQDQVQGVVSGGDTRALMSLSRHLLGTVPGVDRPAIAKELKAKRQTFWMADLGANVHCSTPQLLQIVAMGQMAARHLSGRTHPRVALLNIGTESHKGTGQLAPVYQVLQQRLGDVFVGYVEGSELFDNRADVVVCDGYAGNLTLKAIEGTAAMAQHLLMQQLQDASTAQRGLLWLLSPLLRQLRSKLDTQQYNGAAFLGLNGVVVKSHGGATSAGFASAIRRTKTAIEENLPSLLRQHMAADG